MNKPRTIVGYVRVSSIGQAQEGVSLEAQQEKIKAWAAFHGYQVEAIESDGGKSGGKAKNRPALQRAVATACRLKCPLVVYSLSRMARSVSDASTILDKLKGAGADFASLSESIDTTSAAGRMFFAMLAAFAAFEREVGGERTRTALSHLRQQGRRYSNVAPLGFRFDSGLMVEDPKEQRALTIILEGRGQRSLRATHAALIEAGCVGREGKPWSLGAIRSALHRAILAA